MWFTGKLPPILILIYSRLDTAPMPRRHPRWLVREFERLLPRPGKQTHQVVGVFTLQCSSVLLPPVHGQSLKPGALETIFFLLFLSTDVTTAKQCFGECRLDAAQLQNPVYVPFNNSPRRALTSRVQVKIDISKRSPRTNIHRQTCTGQTPRKGVRNDVFR